MSIAPPGYPTDDTDPGPGSRQADDHERYEFKSVQVLRARASSTTAKWQKQGWELISEDRGTLRTELHFRRAEPKALVASLQGLAAGFRRLQPKTRSAVILTGAMVLTAGIMGIAGATQNERDTMSATSPAEPTATATPVDTPLVDGEPSAGERRAEARARARRQAIRRQRQRNTALLESGVTCDELGETDILVTPGAEIDADNDGVGCES
jgi:hypothetical protein